MKNIIRKMLPESIALIGGSIGVVLAAIFHSSDSVLIAITVLTAISTLLAMFWNRYNEESESQNSKRSEADRERILKLKESYLEAYNSFGKIGFSNKAEQIKYWQDTFSQDEIEELFKLGTITQINYDEYHRP